MRHAFVRDERQVAVAADLELSWREARDGAVVPLDVPVRCTCRLCGGRGETWTERCLRCEGSGTELLRHQVQVSVPPGVTDGDRFCFSVAARHDPPTRIELRVSVA
jgi:DnaJ-class molecular chaperone